MARRARSKLLESKVDIAERRGPDVRRWFGMSDTARDMRSCYEPTFDPSIIDEICRRVCEGESLSKICRDPDMPDISTLMLWQRAEPEIREAIGAARTARAELKWDECLEEIEGIFAAAAASGDKATLHAAQAEAKIKFDFYKFEVSKLLAGIYGDSGDKRLMLERAEARANNARNGGGSAQIIEVPAKELPDGR